jgi:hypothetical protein
MARDSSVVRLVMGCLMAALFTAPVRAQDAEARIWTDKSGKHEIRAKFIDVVDGQVRLERPNGDISRLPLEKLSQADQDYIRDADKPSAKPKPTQPVQPAEPTMKGLQVGDRVEVEHFRKWHLATVVEIDYKWERVEAHLDGERRDSWSFSLDELRYPGTMQQPILVKPSSPAGSLKTVRPDYKGMERLLADGNAAEQIAPDPLVAAESSWKPRAVRLAGNGDPFVRPTDLALVASPTPLAMIVYESDGFEDDVPTVELIDLESREVALTGPAPPGTGRLAMSPTGGRVASVQSEWHGRDSTGIVDFWKIADKKVSHWISFAPYVMNTWPDLDPEWCAWLDDKRLFTMNVEGQFILWQVEGAKAIYELQLDRGARPILSLGRKYLVVPTSMGVQFFDAESGELKAVVGSGDYRRSNLAFSPSGKQLAIASAGFIDVLDVTTGATTRSFPCEEATSRNDIAWIDEQFLFTANGLIIHVPLRLVVWKYEIDSLLVKSFAGSHWALLHDHMKNSRVLVPLQLPPPEAVAAMDEFDEENLLVVRPGDKISIDVQIHDDNILAEEVKRALTEALAEADMQVGDESSLTLVARMKTGKTEKIEYHNFGAFHQPGEVIEVTNRIYELELLLDGVPVWKRESTQSAPMHLHLEKGETTRAAIDRVMKPTGASFRGRLPSYVVRPEYREPLGSSKLSLNF